MSLNEVVTEKVFFLVKFQGFSDPIAGTATMKAGKSEKSDIYTSFVD